jgi:hypothetical protein
MWFYNLLQEFVVISLVNLLQKLVLFVITNNGYYLIGHPRAGSDGGLPGELGSRH